MTIESRLDEIEREAHLVYRTGYPRLDRLARSVKALVAVARAAEDILKRLDEREPHELSTDHLRAALRALEEKS